MKQTDEDYKTLSSEILEKLVKGEKIKVGSEVQLLEQHLGYYYINRTFKRVIKITENENRVGRTRRETISEDKIYEVNDKLVLIADSPGKGKSTVFSKLAVIIKEKYPNLWVFRIDLNEYSGILKKFKDVNEETISIMELLSYKDKTKLSNQLEKVIFSMKKEVVMLFDGVDEISPDYTELVFSLLNQCQEGANFAKVFISTRPHMTEALESKFSLIAFTLLPFTEQDQINFLTNYWSHNLILLDSDRHRCEQYAKILLKATSHWMKSYRQDENHYAAIPLQVKMLAEIFQENNKSENFFDWEGCKEYISGNENMPKLPERVNITKIYKTFIDKKREIFISKENPSGNVGAKKALSFYVNQNVNSSHNIKKWTRMWK